MATITTCTAQNGTYCCQLTSGHAGRHQSSFFSCGQQKRASWADRWAPVVTKTIN